MPTELLTEGLDYPLDEWFESYLRHRPADLPTEVVEVERVLSAPLAVEGGQYRLGARYDLIAVGGDGDDRRAVILDWKTNKRVTGREMVKAADADARVSVCAGGGERRFAVGSLGA